VLTETSTRPPALQLIDEHGMEVYTKYFARLVVANAAQIFSTGNRPVTNAGNHHLLVGEMRKLSRDFNQARNIAESIETGAEDIFRDFDLATFMDHFQLDAFDKVVLALAFKVGNRADLKTKGKESVIISVAKTTVNLSC